MMVTGAQADFDFEDRAEAVRRALGGLAGAKKTNFGFGTSNNKPVMSVPPPATSSSQPLSTPISRIPLQSTEAAQNVSTTGRFGQNSAHKEAANADVKPVDLYDPWKPAAQPGASAVSKSGGTTTVKDAQELLCQLRQTEKQPIRGLEGDTAVPETAGATQPAERQGQVRRTQRNSMVGKNGKKKTEIEKENDRLLDELEALGEPAVEIPGETPVDENQRLRREATAAMLKHSFFMRKRSTPPTSAASSDISNR